MENYNDVTNNIKNFKQLRAQATSYQKIESDDLRDSIFTKEVYQIPYVSIGMIESYNKELSDQIKLVNSLYDIWQYRNEVSDKALEEQGRTNHLNNSNLLPQEKLPTLLSCNDKNFEQSKKKLSSEKELYVVIDYEKLNGISKDIKASEVENIWEKIVTYGEITDYKKMWLCWLLINKDNKYKDGKPTPYLEFTQRSEKSNGRIVLNVWNRTVYWTPSHYYPIYLNEDKFYQGKDKENGLISPWAQITLRYY